MNQPQPAPQSHFHVRMWHANNDLVIIIAIGHEIEWHRMAVYIPYYVVVGMEGELSVLELCTFLLLATATGSSALLYMSLLSGRDALMAAECCNKSLRGRGRHR